MGRSDTREQTCGVCWSRLERESESHLDYSTSNLGLNESPPIKDPVLLFCLTSSAPSAACAPAPRVFWRFWIPAGGSVPGDDLTQASIQAVVGLHLAGALAGQPPHGAVARVTQTLCLRRPAVHHAAGELVARQELAGVRLVGWGGGQESNNDTMSSSQRVQRKAGTSASPGSTSKDRLSISMSSRLEAALQKSSSTQWTAWVTLYGTGLSSFILLFTTTLPFLKLRISSCLNPVRLDCRYGRSCWGGGSDDKSRSISLVSV